MTSASQQPLALDAELASAARKTMASMNEQPDPRGFELAVDEERFPPVVRETSYKAFAPTNIGSYLPRFHALSEKIATLRPAQAKTLIEEEIDWGEAVEAGFVPALRPRSLRKYRAGLSVLIDLIGQNWAYRFRDHRFEMAPPDFTEPPKSPEDVVKQKKMIRGSMRAERLAQLQPETVRRFVADMEASKSRSGKPICSASDLIADGDTLVREIRSASQGRSEAEYSAALATVIDPYLQLAQEEDRCPETGFRLIDIWRYFRYYWSLPYFNTPGRNLFYLVRDRAKPFHPVIGIAALGNSIVRLADRERWIGWDVKGIEETLAAVTPEKRPALLAKWFDHYLAVLETEIAALDKSGLVTAAELAAPTSGLVNRLLSSARESSDRRKNLLREHENRDRSGPVQTRNRPSDPSKVAHMADGSRTLADDSVEELFKQKRAAQFAELLRAKLTFLAARGSGSSSDGFATMLRDQDGVRAIANAIKAVKQQHIGSSIMDIIICGSVPPYADLLGGKLVCMLLASPQVRRDYSERYANSPSEIASKMRGGDHSRASDLVFLGTTSLYHVGSSQYNRVRIPANLLGSDDDGEIHFQRLGETRGYGSVHFSERTRTLMEDIMRDDHGATFITRTFGEGVNPKLRMVREGLAAIGVDQDHFLRHQCRRIIYGVPLATNTGAYLRNEDAKPDFVLKADDAATSEAWTKAIADHWRKRWLTPRSRNTEVLSRVAVASKTDVLVSRAASGLDLSPKPESASDKLQERGKGGGRTPPPSAGEIGVRFIQQLYNNRSCYADRLTDTQLSAIHIQTGLEKFITDLLGNGKDVILTGNPGDGKTHLIMRLMPTIKALGAECHADATAEESYDKILDLWMTAKRRRKPFCLAINEWPLLEFVNECSPKFKPLQEVREQVEHGIVYENGGLQPKTVVVIDLNNRDLVSREVFSTLLSTLTADKFYPECASCPAQQTCDVPKARTALGQERVRSRIFDVLDLVTKRGFHVTMRDLQGFMAYLITGGRSCEQLVDLENERYPRPYFDLAFEGDSALFDAVREVFDPARVTHPIYDDSLWSGDLDIGWTSLGFPAPPPGKTPDPDDALDAMRSAKRRFFFEHDQGDQLLKLLPPDERTFYDALDQSKKDGPRVIAQLVRLINRFFDPADQDDQAIRMWNRHRYDARWSPTYVSVQSVPADVFSLDVPQLPKSTSGAFFYQADHVVLAAVVDGKAVARLMVDLALFRTLFDSTRGLPMALRSPEVLKRIDKFFNELSRAFRRPRDAEEVHIKNFETGEHLRFKVERRHERYAV